MVQRTRFTPEGAPMDPYRAAAESWDGRYGSALAQARNWRLISILQLVIMLLLSGAVIWAFQLRTEVPYVVVLDERGETAQLKVADREYSPTEQQISYHVRQFIEWVRTRPLDPAVFSRNWEQAYAFMNRDAQLKMNQYAADYRPEEGLGRSRRMCKSAMSGCADRTPTKFAGMKRNGRTAAGCQRPTTPARLLSTSSRRQPAKTS